MLTSQRFLRGTVALAMAAGLAVSAPALAASRRNAPQPADPSALQPAKKLADMGPWDLSSHPRGEGVTKTPVLLLEPRGKVQVRRTPTSDWQLVTGDMVVEEGAEVRTGLGSSVVISIGSTQRIIVDKLTTVSVRAAINDNGVERSRIELPLGRVQVDVNSTRVANDVQIAAPDMTLAVRGTTFIMEVTPGFETRTVGAATNTGAIQITSLTGATALLTGQQQATSGNTDPASNAVQFATVESTKSSARETDERQAAERATGSTGTVGQTLGISQSGQDAFRANAFVKMPPAAISRFLAVAPRDGVVIQSDLLGNRNVLFSGFSDLIGPGFTGAAKVDSPVSGSTLYISRSGLIPDGAGNSVARNALYTLQLDDPTATPQLRTDFGSDGARHVLTGLGSIGVRLFASGFEVGNDGLDHVYELFPDADAMQRVMTLPGFQIGGAGGSVERASLFLGGHLALADGSNQFAVLEVDPRANYLISAYGGTDADLTPGKGTYVSPGVDASTIGNISGLAFVDGIIVMSATAVVAGESRSVILQYDPAATNENGDPRLRSVELTDGATYIDALASERGNFPTRLSRLTNPPGPIDTVTINPTFARMAYSEAALRNDILSRMVASEVVNTARDPGRCAASGALDALPSILRNHVDKVAGVGRTVAEFRGSLPVDHPCRAK